MILRYIFIFEEIFYSEKVTFTPNYKGPPLGAKNLTVIFFKFPLKIINVPSVAFKKCDEIFVAIIKFIL